MKVIAYSIHQTPEIFDCHGTREAKKIARQIKNEQRLFEILTEKEFKDKFNN